MSNLLRIYPKFCVLEILWWFMDKNLLHISLTKFNKLNKIRKCIFLITQFSFVLYLAFILGTFSVYLWRVVWSAPVSVQFFWFEVKKNVLWIVCLDQLKIVCFYMITFIFNMVALIFCVLAEQESKKMWSLLHIYSTFCVLEILWWMFYV